MLSVPVGRRLLKSCEEELGLLLRKKVHAVVVVAVAGELTCGFKVFDQAGLRVTDRLNLRVFDGGEGVGENRQACDAESHVAVHVCVVQGHLRLLVGVFVVHVMNHIHGGDVGLRKPVAIEGHALAHLVVVEILAVVDRHLRADLHVVTLVAAAV